MALSESKNKVNRRMLISSIVWLIVVVKFLTANKKDTGLLALSGNFIKPNNQ
jgi:hypothetical protein